MRRYQGKTELAYRRWRQREVIAAADQGDAPPLAARAALSLSPWGAMFGTERLDPSPLRALKVSGARLGLTGGGLCRRRCHMGLAAPPPRL